MDRNKDILILTTTRDFLGKFEKNDVKILKEMGYSIHYACNMKDDLYDFAEEEIKCWGVTVHHVDIERSPYMLRNNRKAFSQLIRIIEEYRIGIIHCHTPVGGLLGRLLGKHFRKDGIKIIYTAHGFHFYRGAPWINNSVYYWVERMLAHYTDLLVVINEEDFKKAGKFRLRKGGALFRLPGVGLDRERFCGLTNQERCSCRAALGIGEEKFFIVSVGELNLNKNQEIILRALARMRDGGTDISGILYGICGNGFFSGRIREQIEQMGLLDHVRMFGNCRNVPEILGCADLSVFPSRREGLGMAALESLAMGVPVVAADNRGTREYMKDGVNGYVCRWSDADGFARGIEKIRGMDQKEKDQMRARCTETAERFDIEYADKVMREVYKMADEMTAGERNGGRKR